MLQGAEDSDVTVKAPIMTTTCATASSSHDVHDTAALSEKKKRCTTACETFTDNQSTSSNEEELAEGSLFHREGVIKGSLTIRSLGCVDVPEKASNSYDAGNNTPTESVAYFEKHAFQQ